MLVLLLFSILLTKCAMGCTCYESGKLLSCDYYADSFSLREAECKRKVETLVWLAPDCATNVKVCIKKLWLRNFENWCKHFSGHSSQNQICFDLLQVFVSLFLQPKDQNIGLSEHAAYDASNFDCKNSPALVSASFFPKENF